MSKPFARTMKKEIYQDGISSCYEKRGIDSVVHWDLQSKNHNQYFDQMHHWNLDELSMVDVHWYCEYHDLILTNVHDRDQKCHR